MLTSGCRRRRGRRARAGIRAARARARAGSWRSSAGRRRTRGAMPRLPARTVGSGRSSRRWHRLAVAKRQLRRGRLELDLARDDPLACVEREPVCDPVVRVDAVEPESVQRRNETSEVTRRDRQSSWMHRTNVGVHTLQGDHRHHDGEREERRAAPESRRDLCDQEDEHGRQHDEEPRMGGQVRDASRQRPDEREHGRYDVEERDIAMPRRDRAVREEREQPGVREQCQHLRRHEQLRGERRPQSEQHRQERRDEQPKAVRVLAGARPDEERAPVVTQVPDDPRECAQNGHGRGHPHLPKATGLLPDHPADGGDRNRDDLRRLPERQAEHEPEQP